VDKAKKTKEGFRLYEPRKLSETEQKENSFSFYQLMNTRRSIRSFSSKAIPEGVLENIILSAATAPSGAHKQPWTFAVIRSSEMKKQIRIAAEKEEYENYHGRMSEEWLADLEKFDTDWNKPFLEEAPAIIVLFKKSYDLEKNGERSKNYYVNESVGIAAGMLITAIHYSGLVTLTHTPSPMNFLAELLKRPSNEKAFLLLPVGYPSDNAEVPILERKSLKEVLVNY
jgi:nitroreductase